MKFAKRFYGYLKKDFLLLYKRKKYLYLFILLPLIIGFLFIFALNPSTYNLKLGVCDLDKTSLSQNSFSNLDGFEPIMFEEKNCVENLQEQIKQGNIDLGIEIPNQFSEELMDLKQSHLNVYYDNTDIAFSNLISWRIDQALNPFKRQVIDNLNTELKSKTNSVRSGINILLEFSDFSKTLDKEVKKADEDLRKIEEMDTEFLINPLWTNKQPIYEESLKKDAGIVFVFPILALFVTLMLASTSIIYDKNNNFITRVKSSASPVSYILAKTLFFTLTVFIQFLIILIIFMFSGGKYALDPLNVLKLILFIGIINTLLGLLIGLISKSEGIAVLFSLMVSFPLMLISGIFFPIQALPKFTQLIGNLLPLQYQINASKAVLLFGQEMTNNWIWFGLSLFLIVWYLVRKN